MRLAIFLIIATSASVLWGRINRIGYSVVITSPARFIMKYSRANEDLIRSYLVWWVYMGAGLAGAVALLAAYDVNLLRFLYLAPDISGSSRWHSSRRTR